MAYTRKRWVFKDSMEVEYTYSGNYGAKGERREKRKKPTPEQIQKQNHKNKENKVRRLLKSNFSPGDYWLTLKYPKGTRLTMEEVKEDLTRFCRSMRGKYKTRGHLFKFIYRIEVGSRGGIHIHMVVNRLPSGETDKLLQGTWTHGRVFYTGLYEEGGFKVLAEYIVKEPEEGRGAFEQMQLFDGSNQKKLVAYSTSRNLIRPEPEVKEYLHWTMRKIIENGPEATEGYYIDKESIVQGVNPFTGRTYLKYTEFKLDNRGRPPERSNQ